MGYKGVLDFYHPTRSFSAFPSLVNGKQQRYEQLGWEQHTTVEKRIGRFYGEVIIMALQRAIKIEK